MQCFSYLCLMLSNLSLNPFEPAALVYVCSFRLGFFLPKPFYPCNAAICSITVQYGIDMYLSRAS